MERHEQSSMHPLGKRRSKGRVEESLKTNTLVEAMAEKSST
jgi:hypothetical protein